MHFSFFLSQQVKLNSEKSEWLEFSENKLSFYAFDSFVTSFFINKLALISSLVG
jgi:hypothetical protein